MTEPPVKEYTDPDTGDNWHRVHPVSPMVKGWIGIIAVIVIFGRGLFEDLIIDGEAPRYGSEGQIVPLWVLVLAGLGIEVGS